MQFLNSYHLSQNIKILTGNFLPSFDPHFHEYHASQNWSKSHLTGVFFPSVHPSGSRPDAIADTVLRLMGKQARCEQDSERHFTISQYSHL